MKERVGEKLTENRFKSGEELKGMRYDLRRKEPRVNVGVNINFREERIKGKNDSQIEREANPINDSKMNAKMKSVPKKDLVYFQYVGDNMTLPEERVKGKNEGFDVRLNEQSVNVGGNITFREEKVKR